MKLLQFYDFYKIKFGFKPKIAILGINPHCESVHKFNEDDKIIRPTIKHLKKNKFNVFGPYSADTIFLKNNRKNFDVIVGMYHDALQAGLKAFGFDRGLSVQGGLPLPVTTPAHGTAFDIAGTNKANLEPTLQSFKIAVTMAENLNK